MIHGFSLIEYGEIQDSDCDAGEYISKCIFKRFQAWNVHKKVFCFAMDDNFVDDIQVRNLNTLYHNFGFVPDETFFHGGCCSWIANSIAVRKLKALCGNEDLLPAVGCCSQILSSIVRDVLNIRSAVSKLRDCFHHVNFSAENKQSFAMCV